MSYRGKSVFVCLLLVAASVWFQAWRGATMQHPLEKPATAAAALQGEAAIQQLKTDGGYASLAAAMTAARYQINAAPANSAAPFYANNPGQQLRATFASDEVRVNAASNQTSGKADGAELRLQLAGYGYGEYLEALTTGEITAHGDRIEIEKSALRGRQGPQSTITEWYVNKPEGLEQGFTLTAPPHFAIGNQQGPQSAIPLRVALSIGEGWRVSLRGDQQGAIFERQADGLRLGYDHLAAYDAQGRTLPARMSLDGGTLSLLVEDAQAAYPLTIDPIITQQRKLTAADGVVGDFFGLAVALSGNTAVVGAPSDAVAVANQGSVHVFVRNGDGWSPQQKLTASDGANNDAFGQVVALSGDTLAVGVPNANGRRGAVYVFTRGGTAWTQQPKITAGDGAAGDQFGFALALGGDTVVVGVLFEDLESKVDRGAAYVFTRSGTVWSQRQQLSIPGGAAFDRFGGSVAISGDIMVVSATGQDLSGDDQGSAYVFARNAGLWVLQRRLLAEDGAAGDDFGRSVALSGDSLLVGASSSAFGGPGAAYVFVIRANNYVQQQPLSANDGAAFDGFGASVALSGDTAVVGAPGDDIGANMGQGSAHVFTRSGTVWTPQQKLVANDGATDDLFGGSVALSGDTVVVGARQDAIGANVFQGSAYVFVRSGTVWTPQQKLTANDGAAGDRFGFSVALSGDTVVVGAVGDAIGANGSQGSAYVFTRSGTTWTPQQKLTANDGAAGDNFGVSVALSGDTVVVGAVGDDIGANGDQGSAYVFTRSGTVWTPQQKLTANDGATFDNFGVSVALSGDTVVVGAVGDDIGGNVDQGSAYVFTRGGTAWMPQQKLTANDGAVFDDFGGSVAISGDTVVVGAAGDDIGGNVDQGSAYVFTRSGTVWTQPQKLTANNGAVVDRFGSSVALSGDTLVTGARTKTIGANMSQGAAYVFVSPACPTITLNPATLPGAQLGAPYSQTVTASASGGGAGTVQFSFSDGTLPPGLTLSPTGQLSGTPTAAGAYRFTITATIPDSLCPGSRGYTLTVTAACPTVTLNPATLPAGQSGAAYSQQLSASGGAAPYSFVLAAGALPGGMSLSAAGMLSGAPAAPGTFNFTVRAADASGCQGAWAYALTIQSPGCDVSVAPVNHAFPAGGGSGVVSVNATAGCAWTAVSNAAWITVTSGASGSGNGTVRFAVADYAPESQDAAVRRGTLSIAGHTVTVVQAPPLACVSAASFVPGALAAESIVAAFGSGLARSTEAATAQPLPTTLAGTRVSVLDSLGVERFAPLFFVSPTQINFQVPPDTAAGGALVTILRDGETAAAGSSQIERVAPGLFSANASGQGLLAGVALRVKADGSQSYEPVARFDEEQRRFVAVPIDLEPAADRVFLVLFATGVRHRASLGAVSVKLGGVNADALYAGPQGSFAGLDQLNVELPRSLAGRGEIDLSVQVEGQEANKLRVAVNK